MDKTGAGAYIFAKANGILGKSFTGNALKSFLLQKVLENYGLFFFAVSLLWFPR